MYWYRYQVQSTVEFMERIFFFSKIRNMDSEQEDSRVASTILHKVLKGPYYHTNYQGFRFETIIQAEDNYLNGTLSNILDGATIGEACVHNVSHFAFLYLLVGKLNICVEDIMQDKGTMN